MKQSTPISAAKSIRRLLRSVCSQSRSSGEPLAVNTHSGMSASSHTCFSRFGGPNQSSGNRPSQPSQPAFLSSGRALVKSGCRQRRVAYPILSAIIPSPLSWFQ